MPKREMPVRPVTPGPWEWRELNPDDPKWELCEVWQADGTEEGELVCSGGLGIANARLIAAAPELLEILAQYIAKDELALKELAGVYIPSPDIAAMHEAAKAAIAKETISTP